MYKNMTNTKLFGVTTSNRICWR